jgi:hypothetical protein
LIVDRLEANCCEEDGKTLLPEAGAMVNIRESAL